MKTRPSNELPSAEYYRRRRVVTTLQDKIKLLEKENKELGGTIKLLDSHIFEMKNTIEELEDNIKDLEIENGELRDEIGYWKRSTFYKK